MKLLSYNIHKGIGGVDRRCRLERVVRVIEHANADILCLQEVTRDARRTHFEDQPQILAERLGFTESAYQMNVHYRRGGYGNLILSRWPFAGRHSISLRLRQRKPRGALAVVIETPEGPLHLVNWHLGLTQRERRWQAEHLLEHRQFRESAHLPTIVAGDFNDWRDRLGAETFAPRGFAEATESSPRFCTFPAFQAVMALDKAFYRGGVEVASARIIRSPLARQASDHLPLIVEFRVK